MNDRMERDLLNYYGRTQQFFYPVQPSQLTEKKSKPSQKPLLELETLIHKSTHTAETVNSEKPNYGTFSK
jgi:hypothetical protein